MNPAISVIIPVYNVKRFLGQCLDSVLAQTFSDFEVICMDDGSSDGSSECLDEYARQDSRIRVIHKANTGYGNSMNVGLNKAKGRYIAIVESDDAILPDFLERMFTAAVTDNLDVIKSECFFCWDLQTYRIRQHASNLNRHFGEVLGKDRLWLRCQFLMNIWNGLYNRDFLMKNMIGFHETPGASYQDNGFWLQCMIYADRFMCLDYAGYLYRQDNESASVKDPKKVYTMADEYEWLAQHCFGRVNPAEMDVINYYRLIRSYWSFLRIGDEFKREYCDRLIRDYDQYKNAIFRDIELQDRFLEIKTDPDAYCKKNIEEKKAIISRLDSARSIIIYGAGHRGERLYRLLINYGWYEKLQCFVESGNPKRDHVGNTPVYRIDDARVDFTGALVFISTATGSKTYDEMRNRLNEMNVTEIADSEPALNYFYQLI